MTGGNENSTCEFGASVRDILLETGAQRDCFLPHLYPPAIHIQIIHSLLDDKSSNANHCTKTTDILHAWHHKTIKKTK